MCFRTPFLPPFFPHFSPLFPLQALCILAPLLPSSPPPSSPFFWLPEKSDLGTPLIWVLFSVLQINPAPATCHKRNGSCAAVFGTLRCRSCTATFAFLQCGHVIFLTKSCAAASEKLQCNIEKAALQETGGILFREYCFGEDNSLSLTEFWGKLG